MISKYKWTIITGLILWCLIAIMTPPALITIEVCRFALVGKHLVYLAIPLIFLLAYILVSRRLKPSPQGRLVLEVSLIVLFFAINLFRAVDYGIITSEYMLKTAWFTVIFSTVFTAVFLIISPIIYRARRKTAREYIAEAVEIK